MINLYYNICIKNNQKIMLLVLKHFFNIIIILFDILGLLIV